MNNVINVAWMYPDVLNLHGERGNAKAFEIVAKKMNVNLNIDRIDNIDEIIDFEKYDILLFNAGELKVINEISNILNNQIEKLKDYIESNKVILVTGTTGALFANKINRLDGTTFNGLNIFDMDVSERDMVIGDDLYFEFENMEIMGSQIQMIDINLKSVNPLGKIKYGYGNNGSNSEGAKYKNTIFTNELGPVLVKNPWMAESLIELALKNKNIEYEKIKLDYELELKSLESTKEFINQKIIA